jgi:hypothetical protein
MKLFNRRFHEFIYLSAEDKAWDTMRPVGREYGSPDYERLEIPDLYSFGEITAGQAMQYIGIDNIETLHLQMLEAEIPIPTPGVSPALKGLFADQVTKAVSVEEMNKAVVVAIGQEFNAYPPDDGPFTEERVEALRQDAAKHLPVDKTVSILNLFDAAKDAADRAAEAIDDSLRCIDESNRRIGAMEQGAQCRLIEVTVAANLTLHVKFKDGVQGIVKFEQSHLTGVFEALKDPVVFQQVHIQDGAVTWPGNLDLAPDAMYQAIKSDGVWILR